MPIISRLDLKKVILRPGDKVSVFNAAGAIQKTIAAVDGETSTITFTDGTTYSAKANPDLQLIVRNDAIPFNPLSEPES